MIRPAARPRAGITLTEILISIMILGIGLTSLATLFPLGLMRLRDASRNTRSAFMAESVAQDVESRRLLDPSTFMYNPWYAPYNYNPWVVDPLASGGGLNRAVDQANTVIDETDLPTFPVAYDPLWRFATRHPDPTVARLDFPPLPATSYPSVLEARFGSGVGSVRPDPASGASGVYPASAHGLQRVTNFVDNHVLPAYSGLRYYGFGQANSTVGQYEGIFVGDIFASPDDIVLQEEGEPGREEGVGSPLLPALTPIVNPTTGTTTKNQLTGRPYMQSQVDWSYSWMVTGRQPDVSNPYMVEGDIVVFQNRAFGTVPTIGPFDPTGQVADTSYDVPIGERVLEAVFGYGPILPNQAAQDFARGADRTVLLRWPASMPDPDIKVGHWIADVTYERVGATDLARFSSPAPGPFPNQRCYWYQIGRRTEPEPGVSFAGDPAGIAYRQMIVTVKTPLRARTLLTGGSTPRPVHVNVALHSPYIVNVFPKVFNTR